MQSTRASAYLHPDGVDLTILELQAALVGVRPLLAKHNVALYDATNMKTGVNQPLLVKAVPVLEKLLAIDPRGGLFLQGHLAKAITNLFEDASARDAKNELLANTTDLQMPFQEVIELMAYKIRVMLSHTRLVHDASKGEEKHPLRVLFKIMAGSSAGAADFRKTRRQSRLGHRPNPFACFRPEESRAAEADAPSPVTKFFDAETLQAQLLMSDGSVLNADCYDAGPSGFIVARWLSPSCEFELQLPNQYLKDDGSISKPAAGVRKKPAAAPVTPMKRPSCVMQKPAAAPMKKPAQAQPKPDAAMEIPTPKPDTTGDPDEGGEEEKQSQPDAEMETLALKIRPGHENKMTITVVGASASDKAQVLEISPSACKSSSLTPREACQKVIDSLAPHVCELDPPARGAEWLPELRDKAKTFKDAVLQQ